MDNKYNEKTKKKMPGKSALIDISVIIIQKCFLLGAGNLRRQISEHIFPPNGGYCLYIITSVVVTSVLHIERASLIPSLLSPRMTFL